MQLEDFLATVLLHTLKYVDNDWRKGTPSSTQGFVTIAQECKEAVCSQIDQFVRSEIYYEKHCRDVVFDISSDLKTYSETVLMRVVHINPSAEDNLYYSQDVFVSRRSLVSCSELSLDSILQVIRKDYRSNLKITINGMSIKAYLFQLGQLYPDKYSDYTTIPDDWDVYSLFSIEEREDSDGLIANIKVVLAFPLDKNIEKHDIKIEYVSHQPLRLGRLSNVFRAKHPCKHLEHKFMIRFKDPNTWEIAFYVFEPFYSATTEVMDIGKERAFSVDRIDKQNAVLLMNYLILPGYGYSYRLLLKEPITCESLTPEFLQRANLLETSNWFYRLEPDGSTLI